MKIIKGVKIDESKDLTFNLQKLRDELSTKYSFWYAYKKGLDKIRTSNNGQEVNVLAKGVYFISLLPKLLHSLITRQKVNSIIRDGEDELIHFYNLPETKIRLFRLQCQQEELKYKAEIQIINKELEQHEDNLKLNFLGDNTKDEINNIIVQFKAKLEKKTALLNFYTDCQKRLLSIEKQIEVKKLIESSKDLINEMVEGKSEVDKKVEMENEFKMFDYYGEILEELNTKFKKVEADDDEKVAAIELKEIISQINQMNLD